MAAIDTDIQLARMDEQLKNLTKQQENLTKQQEKLTEQVSELVAIMNRGKGAFGAAMLIAGAMGAIAVKVVAWATNSHL